MDLRLWLVASTCAGYDDDAQICCEHGGEGGQTVSLTAEVHETTVTSGGDGPGRCFRFSLLLCVSFFFSSHSPSLIGFHFSQRQPDEGWRGMERAASRGL